MNNRDFCIKHAAHIATGTVCPSRHGYADSGAHIHCTGHYLQSYGSHYPLLYAIEREDGTRVLVVNSEGYGQATSKHIGHARSAAWAINSPTVTVYDSKIMRTREGVISSLRERVATLQRSYDSLTRKNTKKAGYIIAMIERTNHDIKTITQ